MKKWTPETLKAYYFENINGKETNLYKEHRSWVDGVINNYKKTFDKNVIKNYINSITSDENTSEKENVTSIEIETIEITTKNRNILTVIKQIFGIK